ncbi:MAG: hypothetical protein EAZ77_05365 [Nostocales cyanobacterium]|nr:MAG: hypothetical protein EAZ77_05365 [Nostocales cyanobacterium]
MFGFIKNLIGGILGFITGLFGKKDSYYLELKDEVGQPKPAVATPAAAAKAAPAKVAAVKETATPAKATTAEPAKPVAPTETTFAPQYLVPSYSGTRRRPGANMNTYLDMARQAKVPG